METNELSAYYQVLDLPQDASLKELEDTYYQLRGQLICSGRKNEIPPLKAAYAALKQHLLDSSTQTVGSVEACQLAVTSQSTSEKSSSTEHYEPRQAANPTDKRSPIERLTADLADEGMNVRASVRGQTLHVGVVVTAAMGQKQVTDRVYELLSEVDYGFKGVAIARIYGLKQGQQSPPKTLWKTSFPFPNLHATNDDQDLYSFNNRISNTLIFPGILLFAFLLNSIEAIKLLLFGMIIWIHELGHATVGWLGGYRALPLPFGWTSISANKSAFVYLGVLTLLGLLFWTGKKERRLWPMVLASVLAIAQFYMTWVISDNTFETLFSFGGIGGEFYLSTLLIVSFYFPLPAKWRWDFYRYPAMLMAGFTFIAAFSRWRQIKRGLEAIPWGTMLMGSGDAGGDMNRLVSQGWSDQRIIDTYNSLGSLCLIVIISVYFYFFLKQRNHLFLYSLWRKSQAAQP